MLPFLITQSSFSKRRNFFEKRNNRFFAPPQNTIFVFRKIWKSRRARILISQNRNENAESFNWLNCLIVF